MKISDIKSEFMGINDEDKNGFLGFVDKYRNDDL